VLELSNKRVNKLAHVKKRTRIGKFNKLRLLN